MGPLETRQPGSERLIAARGLRRRAFPLESPEETAYQMSLYNQFGPAGLFYFEHRMSVRRWRGSCQQGARTRIPPPAPAVAGIRRRQLVTKLRVRKHASGGSRMVRRRICETYPAGSLKIHLPQPACPACPLWEMASRKVRTGGRTRLNLTGRKITSRP